MDVFQAVGMKRAKGADFGSGSSGFLSSYWGKQQTWVCIYRRQQHLSSNYLPQLSLVFCVNMHTLQTFTNALTQQAPLLDKESLFAYFIRPTAAMKASEVTVGDLLELLSRAQMRGGLAANFLFSTCSDPAEGQGPAWHTSCHEGHQASSNWLPHAAQKPS